MDQNYYKILGVNENATDEEIKRAYRKKALEFHPDKNPSANPEIMKEITVAYDVLKDPEKKSNYDHSLSILKKSRKQQHYSNTRSTLPTEAEILEEIITEWNDYNKTTRQNPEIFDDQVISDVKAIYSGHKYARDLSSYSVDNSVKFASYYKINVKREWLKHGFLIYCKSKKKDNFKIGLFDKTGNVIIGRCSQNSRYEISTKALLIVIPHQMLHIQKLGPFSEILRDNNDPLGFIHDIKVEEKHPLKNQDYVFAVYNNNEIVYDIWDQFKSLFESSPTSSYNGNYELEILPITDSGYKRFGDINNIDQRIFKKQTEFLSTIGEFEVLKTKEKSGSWEYQNAKQKLNDQKKQFEELYRERDDYLEILYSICKSGI